MSSKKQILIFVVVVIVGMMTIPRLFINYGWEGDVLRDVKAAEEFFSTGVYHPSRLPGTPLFDGLLAIIVPWGGYIASNLTILILYGLTIGIFSFLVRERNANMLLIVIFALTPVLLVNAVTTMDYIPALAAMLCAYVFATNNRYIMASIFLGLSIGLRISGILFVIPIMLFLLLKRRKIYEIIVFFFVSILIGFSFYIPIFIQAGFHLFDFQLGSWPGPYYLSRIIYNAIMLFGPLATIGILAVALANSKNILQSFKQNLKIRSPSFILELTTIAVYIALFIGHPHKTYYLIPIIPFFYFMVSRWLSKRQLILIGALIFSFAFFTVDFKGGQSGKRMITFKPDWGVIIRDYISRNELELLRNGIGQFDRSDKAIILTGMGAILTYKNNALLPADYNEISPDLLKGYIGEIDKFDRIVGRKVYLVYSLPKDIITKLREQGYSIYMFSFSAPSVAINKYKYNPYQMGIERLDVFNKKAFYKGKE